MCSRCIRFSDEIVDDDVLGFTDRGSHTVLTVHPGKQLANNYSLTTVDICPVGALTSNDFRFAMRVWFLKETPSIDVNCGTGANILIHSREEKINRITPRENNAVNSCRMPDSHRLNFHYLDGPDRLTDPVIRENGAHRLATWEECLSRFEKVCDYGPGEVAIIGSARMTNEELFLLRRLASTLEAPLDVVPRQGESDGYLISADRNPNTNGAKVVLGLQEPGQRLADIRNAVKSGSIKCLLVFGEDLTEDAEFAPEDLSGLDFLMVSHLLANETASNADVVLPTAAWAEKRGSMINVTGRLQRLNQAIDPPGDARDDWEVIRDLIQRITASNGIYLIEDVFKSMAEDIEVFSGLNLSKIGDLGVPVIETGVTIPLLEKEAERKAKGLIVG